MTGTVVPQNITKATDVPVPPLRLPIVETPPRDSTTDDSDLSALSDIQRSWLRPEFTEALVEHMHRAKRLAIQDHRE